MPRRRDPNKPVRKRARLGSAAEITTEISRVYRRLETKEITEASAARRVTILTALHAGMLKQGNSADASYKPATINVFSVPHDRFLTHAEIEANRGGQAIVDIAQCEKFEAATPIVSDNVRPLRLLAGPAEPAPNSDLSELETKLLQMSPEQLLELARSLNVGT
jgi:hypothetical protein